MQGAFALSSEAKAVFAIELTDRRLAEAEQTQTNPASENAPTAMTFAVQSKMSADVQGTAELSAPRRAESDSKAVRAAEKAEAAIATLATKDPDAAAALSIKLTATLETHVGVLENLAASGDMRASELITRSSANTNSATTSSIQVKVIEEAEETLPPTDEPSATSSSTVESESETSVSPSPPVEPLLPLPPIRL